MFVVLKDQGEVLAEMVVDCDHDDSDHDDGDHDYGDHGVDDLEKSRHCGAKLEDFLDFNGVSANLIPTSNEDDF